MAIEYSTLISIRDERNTYIYMHMVTLNYDLFRSRNSTVAQYCQAGDCGVRGKGVLYLRYF